MSVLKESKKKNYQKKTSLLLTIDSFHCVDEKGDKKGPVPPSKVSSSLTVAFIVMVLVLHEQIYRFLLFHFARDLHPVLEIERHRHILARHIAVDAFSCAAVAFIAYKHKHFLRQFWTMRRDQNFHHRLHQYNPAGHQVLLFFFSYQVKNMYDTIKWNDGIVFILHHVFAGAAAWGGMYPGVASVYSLFFMGISEISTCILCLLANFDDDFGVKGLDQAFPMTRMILGVTFVVTFVICRILLWPLFTFHFLGDARQALERNGPFETPAVKNALRMMMVACCGLSILQVIWLGEIVMISKQELSKLLL
jgi:TLC domain.